MICYICVGNPGCKMCSIFVIGHNDTFNRTSSKRWWLFGFFLLEFNKRLFIRSDMTSLCVSLSVCPSLNVQGQFVAKGRVTTSPKVRRKKTDLLENIPLAFIIIFFHIQRWALCNPGQWPSKSNDTKSLYERGQVQRRADSQAPKRTGVLRVLGSLCGI